MDFKTDIHSLTPKGVKVKLEGAKLPNNKDIYFRSKQWELLEQYGGARRFLIETETEDWTHWFVNAADKREQSYFEWVHKAYFIEIALMYYNIVVDLSWTLCYVAAEFALKHNGQRVDFAGMMSIDEAYGLLRGAEANVTAPTAETNPFMYLKKMCPEFERAIDIIVSFWESFADSNIRKTYNYCKHKGKPSYKEIEAFSGSKIMSIFIEKIDTKEKVEIPNDTRDVRWSCSIQKLVEDLKEFDDNTLFPYISELLNELENVIQPSPLTL